MEWKTSPEQYTTRSESGRIFVNSVTFAFANLPFVMTALKMLPVSMHLPNKEYLSTVFKTCLFFVLICEHFGENDATVLLTVAK